MSAEPFPSPFPIGKIAAALAKAQGAMSNPKHDSKASIPTKTGGKIEFTFASLAALRDAVIKPLSDNGIALVQFVTTPTAYPEAGFAFVSCVTKLIHESGEWLEFPPFSIPIDNTDPKAIGAAETYARRYSLAPAVCVASDEDTDTTGLAGSGLGPVVSAEQLKDLRKLIGEVDADENRLLKLLKLDKLEHLRAVDLPNSRAMIEAKRK
jgi:hypothetical protein